MVSGLPDEDVIHDWMGQDRFDTFPKPFTGQELITKVRTMLAAQRPVRPNARRRKILTRDTRRDMDHELVHECAITWLPPKSN